MGVTLLSSSIENKVLDGSVQPKQAAANSFGTGLGKAAEQGIDSIPAFRPFAPILAPTVGSITNYGITALSTAAAINNKTQ
jgi:hypothetical protein